MPFVVNLRLTMRASCSVCSADRLGGASMGCAVLASESWGPGCLFGPLSSRRRRILQTATISIAVLVRTADSFLVAM